MSEIYDVVIIGAGASGMTAAGRAGESGLKSIVLEKKSRPGIKLSITGKGKCNLTNSAAIKDFVKYFKNGKFLYSAFRTFSNEDTISFFESLGVACKLERGGRYFPISNKASDIVNALIKYVKKSSSIITSFEVKSVTKKENLFIINDKIFTNNVIVACGGITYPSTGSTGDGYKIAESFGHTISKPAAALVPVNLKSDYLKELKGLKLKNVEVSLINGDTIEAKEFGEMEFTAFGADGPIILTLSGIISDITSNPKLFLSLNLKPALDKDQINQRLIRELDKFGQYQLKDMFKELLPVQIIKPFIKYCGLSMTKKCSQINRYERKKILNCLVCFSFEILSLRDVKEAIITRGGVLTDEIDQKTMQSKIVKGLYFCGEVIDIDAPTGGFNLQAAFSTGYLAGNSIKKYNSENKNEHI
ncbi:MAG: NAD(P)/FAD-dependent oxidoreductase [Endomicrobium sp.]|jgi:predicted Rossmann fold flavoprotein|nr:NAD(P)/FAD-dependent oxidoreductase [Endomicrobium sp.]